MSLAYIYNPQKQQTITFDGITEISHALSLKVETDADNAKGTDYINNAKHEPDRVTLNVIMSNVSSAAGTWEADSHLSRSESDEKPGENYYSNRVVNTLSDLVALKESRTLCQVITDLRTYLNMLLTDITVTRDESNPSGWSGVLAFQEVTATASTAAPVKTHNNTSTTSNKGNTNTKTAPTLDLSKLHVL